MPAGRRVLLSSVVGGLAVLAVVGVSLFFAYDALEPEPGPGKTPAQPAIDIQGPRLLEIAPSSPTYVDIVFDEPVDAASVQATDFPVTGLRVVETSLTMGGRAVRLRVEPQHPGRAYVLRLAPKAVSDREGNPSSDSGNVRFAGFGASGGWLDVTQGDGRDRPAARQARRPKDVTVVDQLHLTAVDGDVVVSRIAVRALSNADSIFAEIVEAWLFEDNGDGMFSPDGRDPQLSYPVEFSGTSPGAPALFEGLDYTLESGRSKDFWVVYRLGNLALEGRTLGSKVGPEDIVLAAGRVKEFAPVVSSGGGKTLVIDPVGPVMQTARLIDPVTIDISFDDVLDPRSLDADSFKVGEDRAADVALQDDGRTVRISLSRPTDPASGVTVTYDGDQLTDLQGNGSAAGGTVAIASVRPAPRRDLVPPTIPGGITVSKGTTDPLIATVGWSIPSSDASGVVSGYRVWRSMVSTGGFESVGATLGLSFQDRQGVPGQAYWYRVSAYDNSGNESTASAAYGSVTATWTQMPHKTYTQTSPRNVCSLCHATHQASTSFGLFRKSYTTGTGEIAVCYDCHDGSAGYNIKTHPTDSFSTTIPSGHTLEGKVDTMNVDLTNTCSGCHGPHQDGTSRPMLVRSTINGAPITGNDSTWCLACHDDAYTWYGAGYASLLASPNLDASGYPTLGTFPGRTAYTQRSSNAHASLQETAGSYPGECRVCHASHRGPSRYDALIGTISPSTSSTVLSDRQTGAYASLCLDCHDNDPIWGPKGAEDIKVYVTAEYADPTKHGGHRIESTGGLLPVGAPLPCYDCHNAHGSLTSTANLSDNLGRNLTTWSGTPEDVRKFCLTCHTTSEGQVWTWTGAAMAYVPVRTTMTVEGLRRDGAPNSNLLRLANVDGHQQADVSMSCYDCHGAEYTPGKPNVHNPSPGESAGGAACFTCHDTFTTMRDSSTTYHHYVATDSAASYPVIANPAGGLTAAQRSCLGCHADHDIFNPSLNASNTVGRSKNLRASIGTAPVYNQTGTYLATDYEAGNGGICVSCHRVQVPRSATNRKTTYDRGAGTVPVPLAGFGGSGHSYLGVPSAFKNGASQFSPNCAKCHNDRLQRKFQTATPTYEAHESTTSLLLTDAGQSIAEDPREQFCWLCHSRATDPAPRNPNGSAYSDSTTRTDFYASPAALIPASDLAIKSAFTSASIVSSHPVSAGQVECVGCHNVHAAGPSDRTVQYPADTLLPGTYYVSQWWLGGAAAMKTDRDWCLVCHDGGAPTAVNNGTSYVPYTVTVPNQSTAINPSKRSDNKQAYTAKSHYNTSVSGEASATARAIDKTCGDCHDRHSSTLPSLLGTPKRDARHLVTGGRYIYRDASNAATVTGNDTSVCWACHTASTGIAETRDASGYPMTGRYPGKTVASAAYSMATHLGNPHMSANATWPGPGDYAGGDCKNCHDVHGTANAYDELRTENAIGKETSHTYGPDRASGRPKYGFCFNCHDGGATAGPAGRDIKMFYPVSAGGTSTAAFSGHRIQSEGGTLPVGSALPCYDCHNSHGSGSTYGLQVNTGLTILGDVSGEITMGTSASLVDVRNFCFACHTSADPTPMGYNGGGALAAVPAGTEIEGLDRITILKLPDISGFAPGHAAGDVSKSCYECHGDRNYGVGGNNVHSPDVQAVSYDCYSCHGAALFKSMDGTVTNGSRTGAYHHVLGNSTQNADMLGAKGSYPTSNNDVFCISCHVDHDWFDPTRGGSTRAMNLRQSVDSTNGANRANSDFVLGTGGVCISCHDVRLGRDVANQKPAESTWTPVVNVTSYTVSAHQYVTSSTVTTDSSTFASNCSKCHNSSTTSRLYQNKSLGTHTSSERNLAATLGAIPFDPQGEGHCYGCHSRVGDIGSTGKPQTGRDWYNTTTRPMSALAEAVFRAFNAPDIGSSRHPVTPNGSGSELSCENCHNPHVVSTVVTATDPDNNYLAPAYGSANEKSEYCLRCHDAAVPKYVLGTSAYVANDVTMAGPKVDKRALEGGSHWTVNGGFQTTTLVACQECHDKHGSKFGKLLGIYDSLNNTATIRGEGITGNDNTVCYPCHRSAGTGAPPANPTLASMQLHETYRDQYGFPDPTGTPSVTTPRWAGSTEWNSVGTWLLLDGRTIKRSPHGNTSYTFGGKPVSDCKTCHDVHGTSQPSDELTPAYRPAGGVYPNADYKLCFNCHSNDGAVPGYATVSIKQYYPPTGGGTNSNENAGHVIKTTDPSSTLEPGQPLPCYDCHGMHGSANGNYWLISDSRWSGIGDTKNDAAANRRFCLGCHVTDDGFGWSNGTWEAVPQSDTDNLFEGIPRNPTAGRMSTYPSKLRIPFLNSNPTAHQTVGVNSGLSCSKVQCHGSDKPYEKATSFNVHNPSSGPSAGGRACYACHTNPAYLGMEDQSGATTGSTTTYHHVLGGTFKGIASEGDTAPATSLYPTSTTEVFCVSCHADHNYFNGLNTAKNLRANIASASVPETVASDFLTTGANGICVSCHTASLPKDTTAQKNDGSSTAVPRIEGATYTASAHQYNVSSWIGTDTNTFSANCSKCHDDNVVGVQGSTYKFGTHTSAERRILAALGYDPLPDNLSEQHCFRCHSEPQDFAVGSKPTTGFDWYATRSMSTTSQKVWDVFQLSGSIHPVNGGANRVECVNCHNEHIVSATEPVTDPDNSYFKMAFPNAWASRSFIAQGDRTKFCMKCHDGNTPRYGVSGSTYVPVDATITAYASLLNKAVTSQTAHYSVTASSAISSTEVQTCVDCHDKHGSNVDKLLGLFDPATGKNKVRSTEVTANNNIVCQGCHDLATTNFTSPVLGQTGYPNEGTWPGFATWNTTYDYATKRGSFHTSAGVVWPGKESTYTAGDCKNCHDVHGTRNDYDMLRTETTQGVSTYTLSPTSFRFCFNCHDGNGPSKRDVKQYYPASAGGTSSAAYAGHKIESVGASVTGGLPCYDCHNPHGSGTAYGIQVNAGVGVGVIGDVSGEVTVGPSAETTDTRHFCFTCHTAGGYGWDGQQMSLVPATAYIEGLLRTDTANHLGINPSTSGHAVGYDQSCQDCHGQGTNNVHNPSGGGASPAAHETSFGAMYASTSFYDDGGCYGCHYQNVWQDASGHGEHYEMAGIRGYTCDTCHANANATVAAIANAGGGDGQVWDKTCTQCHQAGRVGAYHSPASGALKGGNLASEFNTATARGMHRSKTGWAGVRTNFGSITPRGGGTPVNVTSWMVTTTANPTWFFLRQSPTAWTTSSMVKCNSCHGNADALMVGPHGAAVPNMHIDPAYPLAWRMATPDNQFGAGAGGADANSTGIDDRLICDKCHDLTDGATFVGGAHKNHSGRAGALGGACNNCHVGIPHGWARPRFLGYSSDPAPYNTLAGSLDGIELRASSTPDNWAGGNCLTVSCKNHSVTPVWP